MRMSRLLLIVLLLHSIGCRGIGVRKRTAATDLFSAWRASIANDTISARTTQTLRSWDLARLFEEKPYEAFVRLQSIAEQTPSPDVLFALSEMSYQFGKETESNSCSRSLDFYYLCAGYAYHYLYSTRRAESLEMRSSPFDPRFRAACDLYNVAVAQCLRAAQKVKRLDASEALHIPTCDRRGFSLTVAHHGFAWKAEDFGELLLAEDYEPKGLTNQHRTYGLGVPLIVRRSVNPSQASPGVYPPRVSFPATAFLRFQGTLRDLRESRSGQLDLYNPLTTQTVRVDNIRTPLETDLTTPLAFFLQENDLSGYGIKGLLTPAKVEGHAGLYMLEPYQPGKIPVILVHGLLSSPLTWAPMFNDLQADSELRSKYQFWFYFYPTAHPYLNTAADLREAIAALKKRCDPQEQDPALNEMVCVSHSMGGLISKLLTVDSGEDFWKLVSDQPIDQIAIQEKTREELKRIFYFKKLPCVKRVVFLGTPHRGSRLSPSFAGQLLRKLISLPERMLALGTDVRRAGGQTWFTKDPDDLPTSIDLLAPDAPALMLLASRQKPMNTSYHSIIGVAEETNYVKLTRFIAGEDIDQKGDGVVTYASAHLAEADSEKVVRADHGQVHQHPLSVREVRRILLDHAKNFHPATIALPVPASRKQ